MPSFQPPSLAPRNWGRQLARTPVPGTASTALSLGSEAEPLPFTSHHPLLPVTASCAAQQGSGQGAYSPSPCLLPGWQGGELPCPGPSAAPVQCSWSTQELPIPQVLSQQQAREVPLSTEGKAGGKRSCHL